MLRARVQMPEIAQTSSSSQAQADPEKGRRGRDSWCMGNRLMLVGCLMIVGCGQPKMPAPDVAVQRYIAAVRSRDVETVWSMMNSSARRSVSKPELAQLLAENHQELITRAKELETARRPMDQRALLFLDSGSQVELLLEGGQFRLSYQQLLAGDATSPRQAVDGLRVALEQRDYRRVVALFSAQLRTEAEASVESLLGTLSGFDAAVLDVQGDSATYTFPGGGVVQLKKVGETWLITELP